MDTTEKSAIKPCYNTAFHRLKNIAESRDECQGDELRGQPICGHETEIRAFRRRLLHVAGHLKEGTIIRMPRAIPRHTGILRD
jgi:hypothetical protein